jgi:hypothetical protein
MSPGVRDYEATELHHKQLIADLVQALARTRLDADVIQFVVMEFQSIRKTRKA